MPKPSDQARRDRARAEAKLASSYGWPAKRSGRGWVGLVGGALAIAGLIAVLALVAGQGPSSW